MFYINNTKIIPSNLFELLTWEALAHFIMCDGTYSSGVTLQTQCYSIKDVVFIVNVLIIKFNLNCNIHPIGRNNQWVIYIKSKSIKKNLNNLLPYIDNTMKYKVLGPKYKLVNKYK